MSLTYHNISLNQILGIRNNGCYYIFIENYNYTIDFSSFKKGKVQNLELIWFFIGKPLNSVMFTKNPRNNC